MSDKKKNTDLIERFLDGILSESEKNEFEQALKNDPDFSDLYHFRLKMSGKWKQASVYEKVKKNVERVIRAEKKKKKQVFFYRIAAILIIGIVIPIAIYNYREQKDGQPAEPQTFPLQMHMPDYDASIRFFDESYKQKLPLNKKTFKYGKPIFFKWESGLDVRTAIVIKQADTDSIIWRVPIPSKIKEYELKKEIARGEYAWEMEGFEGKKQFKIE